MIIWSGWGFLAFLIPFFILIATEIISESYAGDNSYYQTHPILAFIALAIGAVFVHFVGKYVSKKKGRHTLFFIDIRYWPIILTAIGILAFIFSNKS